MESPKLNTIYNSYLVDHMVGNWAKQMEIYS
jgi:hypothetical protein